MGSCVSSQENPKEGVFLQPLSQSGVEPCPVLSGDSSSSCFINPVVPSSVVDAKEKTNSSLQQQQKQHHRPTLTIYTEVDDINLKDGGWSFPPSLEGFGYTLTPVVPVTPFVARDSRKLTVDVFNEYYSGPKKTTYMEEKKEQEEKEDENYIYVNNKNNSGGMKPSCTHEGNRENRVGLVQLMSYEEKPPQPPVSSQSLQFSFVSVGGGGEGGSVDELKRSCSHTTEQAPQKPAMSPSSLIEGEKGDFSVAAAFSATTVEKARKNTTKSEKRRFFFFLNPDSKIRSVTSKKKEEGKENQKNRQKNSRTADDEQGKELSNLSREQIICVGLKRLQKRLDDLKLVEHHVKNDGNCQFRALAQQLFGSEDLHELVRVHVVTYMKQFRERFDCYFASKQEADEYYRNMLKDGTWGDELTLRGASDGLHVNIHVLSSEQQNFYITYRPGEDAPSPPPAFLVDVATMRQKWRSASASGVNCGVQAATRKELEKGEVEAVEGTGAVGGGGMRSISTASEKERGDGRRINKKRGCYSEGDLTTPPSSKPWTPFKSKETVEPKPNVKNPAETVEEKEDFLLDVCALQRTLQWKLTHSTIRTASTPVVDISQEGGGGRIAANHESSLSFDVSDAAVMMQAGDSLNKSGIGSIGGCLDVSLELPNCVESPGATNSLHLAGLLTVPDEIAKFSAVGAENMEGKSEQSITILIPQYTPAMKALSSRIQQEQQTLQQQQQDCVDPMSPSHLPSSTLTPNSINSALQTVVAASPVASSNVLPLNSEFRAFSLVGVRNGRATQSAASDTAQSASCTPLPASELNESTNSNNGGGGESSSYPSAADDDDQRICFVFEGHSEPIDVFLSYLSPVHYNALSPAGVRNSQSVEQLFPKQDSMKASPTFYSAGDAETSLPFLRRATTDCVPDMRSKMLQSR